MKSPSIALFLALSAGYLGAATADPITDKKAVMGKEAIAHGDETSQLESQQIASQKTTSSEPTDNKAEHDT
ncbi:hypothetical protein [Oceanisphaera sp.]|uniref:hypothetical protein n=1 Tax=Oceanisphaera sp. TaxID=1929979 RepID=UPI003A921A8E